MAEKKLTISNNGQAETLKNGAGNVKFSAASIQTPKKEKLQPGMVRLPEKVKLSGAFRSLSPGLVEQSRGNPFKDLPFPSPGDRIKADDFKKLSQSLEIIDDIYQLSSTLFGQEFGDAKLALAAHGYEIQRVMSVFGNEIKDLEDESLDQCKIIQVLPVEPGEQQVMIILTEQVEIRPTMPNLIGKTYREANMMLSDFFRDIPISSTPITVPDFRDLSLSSVEKTL